MEESRTDRIRELERGEISDEFRLRCAIAVFEKTSKYDAQIAAYMAGDEQPATGKVRLELV